MSDSTNSASARIFAIPELVEMILLKIPDDDQVHNDAEALIVRPATTLFLIHRVNHIFNTTLKTSPSLRKRLYRPEILNITEIARIYGGHILTTPGLVYCLLGVSDTFTRKLCRAWYAAEDKRQQQPHEDEEEECEASWKRISMAPIEKMSLGLKTRVRMNYSIGGTIRGRAKYERDLDEEMTLGKLLDWERDVLRAEET